MIGFWLVNLLPPGNPQSFNQATPAGTWNLSISPNFTNLSAQIAAGACANTYSLSFSLPTGPTRGSVKDAAFNELMPICLAASFATGMAVTIRNSLPTSEISFVVVGPHFPRDRGILGPTPCVNTLNEFTAFVERFVDTFNAVGPTERFRLLMHFYIDALSCWSLENLYLSSSTLLQIIADTEQRTGRAFAASHAASRGGRSPAFFDYLAGAANRVGIPPLSHDVVKIRNSLIHEGTLKQPNFPTQTHAATPIAEALRWVDEYVYAVLGLGPVPKPRHAARDYDSQTLNSFSF